MIVKHILRVHPLPVYLQISDFQPPEVQEEILRGTLFQVEVNED